MENKETEQKNTVRNPFRKKIIQIINNDNFSKEEKYSKTYYEICAHTLENVGFRGTKKNEMLELVLTRTLLNSLELDSSKNATVPNNILKDIYQAGLVDLKYSILKSKRHEIKKREAIKSKLIQVYQKNKDISIEETTNMPSTLFLDLAKVNKFHIEHSLGKQKKHFNEQVRQLKFEIRMAIEGYREGWWSQS